MNKRKTVLFLLSVLLAGWAVYSCSMDELEAPALEDSGRYGGFGAREARAYFEAHATDLSVPRFDPQGNSCGKRGVWEGPPTGIDAAVDNCPP